jgi:cytochrome P450
MSAPRIPVEMIAPAFNPATFADRGPIHDLFTRLRQDYPLAIAEVPGYDPHWIVTKFDDVREITRQDDLFHGGDRSKTLISQAGEAMVMEFTGGQHNIFRSLVQLDPPEHRAYRDVLTATFMPGNIAKLSEGVRETARTYVDRMASLGTSCDFARDVAFRYPLKVVLDLMGVPAEDHEKMLTLTQWLFQWADPDLKRPGADPTNPTEITQTWNIVYNTFKEYYEPLIAARRAQPTDDITSLIANGKVFGSPMEERAMISYLIIASTAGHDTTSATTAMGMWVLAEQPELLARLKADLSLIPNFVEETIRWTTPVQHFIRSATTDYELRGQTIRKGDLLYISYLSANRDEDAIIDPFTFSLDRIPNRHVGFGYGGHICLGQHLARLEMKSFWEELLPRLDSVAMAGPGQMSESEFVSGPKSVPITFQMR